MGFQGQGGAFGPGPSQSSAIHSGAFCPGGKDFPHPGPHLPGFESFAVPGTTALGATDCPVPRPWAGSETGEDRQVRLCEPLPHGFSYSPLGSHTLGQTHSQLGSLLDKFFKWVATCWGRPREEALNFCQGPLPLLLSPGVPSEVKICHYRPHSSG